MILTTKPIKLEVLNYIEWLKDIPLVDMTLEQLVGRILLGNYVCELIYDDDKEIGIVIYYIQNTLCFIIGIWCRGGLHGTTLVEQWYRTLKNNGIREVRCMTNGKIPDYSNIVKMDKLWEVYGRKL